MRAVIQRVKEACVRVDGKITGQIEKGLLVLVGVEDADNDEDINIVDYLNISCYYFIFIIINCTTRIIISFTLINCYRITTI